MLRSYVLTVLVVSLTSTSAEYTCTAEGIFPDPDHCEKYVQCAKGVGDGYDAYVNTCVLTADGRNTLWNACDNACEDPEVFSVCCGPRPLPDGTVQDPDADIYDCDACGDGATSPPPDNITTVQTTPGVTFTETSLADTTATDAVTATEGTTNTPSCDPCDHPVYPEKIMGFYLPLADDLEEGYETNADWDPQLYPYLQEAANVLFFTFINPITMIVPNSFLKLASSRGTDQPGAVPQDTVILFAIGGYTYSLGDYGVWPWLESRDAAEAMAEQVAEWKFIYNCDGIDLDIETGAGDVSGAGENLVYFLRRLQEIDPDFIVSQPTFGYPQVQAEIDVINASWNADGSSNGLADSIGIMVYEGASSLDYIENYAHGTEQWEGFPITVNVPYNVILVGSKGTASAEDIDYLANEVVRQDLLGIMVWFASVVNGLSYDSGWDCSSSEESQQAYIQARSTMGIPPATISK